MSTEELAVQALRLPHSERASLAQRLIDSLDSENETERAWAEEAKRRYEELRSGDVEAVPADQVFAEAHSALE